MTNKPIAHGNVILTMKGNGIISEANRIKSEMRQLQSVIRQSTPVADSYSRKLDIVQNAYRSGAITAKQFANAQEFLNAKMRSAEGSKFAGLANLANQIPVVQNASGAISNLTSTFAGLGPAALAAGAALAGIGISIAAVIAGAKAAQYAFSQMLAEAKVIDEIGDSAKKLGLRFNDLVILRKSFAETSGLDESLIGNSLQRMQIGLVEAARGGGDLYKQLRALGLDAKELINMGPVQALQTLASKTQQMQDKTSQLALAYELFGKQGAQLVLSLREGSAPIESMAKHARQFGLLLNQVQVEQVGSMNDSFGRLGDVTTGIFRQAAAEFAPALTVAANEAASLLNSIKAISPFIPELVNAMARFAGNVVDAGQAMLSVERAARQLMQGNFAGAGFEIFKAQQFDMGEKFVKMIEEQRRLQREAINPFAELDQSSIDFEAELAKLEALKNAAGFGSGDNALINLTRRLQFEWKRLVDQAEATRKKVEQIRNDANPMIKIQQEASEVGRLSRLGLINKKEEENALLQLAKQMNQDKPTEGPRSPSLISADSSEAYKWVMNQRSQTQKLEEQKRIQAQQLQVLKNIMKNTENLPVMGVAG